MAENTDGGRIPAAGFNKIKSAMKSSTSRIVIISITTLVLILVCVVFSPLFNIQNVIIEGNHKVSDEEIIKIAGIDFNKNIFTYKMSAMEKSLSDYDYIESAVCERESLTEIKITVEESYPVAYIPFVGTNILIDKRGKILEASPTLDEGFKIPKICGIQSSEFTINEIIKVSSEDELSLICTMLSLLIERDLISKISEINIEDINNITLVYGNSRIIFGNFEEAEYKLDLLKEILKSLGENEHGTLDLTTAPNVLYKAKT